MTRAEGDVVIVEGKCDKTMCTGRKTSDGKQVCVTVGYISPLNDKCYECFGPNQGERDDLSVAHWEETDMGKCLDISTPPSSPSSCPICPTCGVSAPTPTNPGGPTATPNPGEPTTTPNPTGPTPTPSQPKKTKVIYSNNCKYDIDVYKVFTYSALSSGGLRTEQVDRSKEIILKPGEKFEENFSIACDPYFGVLADCINNGRGNASDSLVIDNYCLATDNETYHVDIDKNCNLCTAISPTPTPTRTPTPTGTPTPTSTPQPSPTPPPQNGSKIINIKNNFTQWSSWSKMVKIYKVTLNNNSIINLLPRDTIKISESLRVDVSNNPNCSIPNASNSPAPMMIEYKPCNLMNVCAIYGSLFVNKIIPCDQSSFEVNINLE